MLKSYTSSPATPDGKIVPSFHGQHLNRRLLESESPTLAAQDLEGSKDLGIPTRLQPSYKLPPGYGSVDEREVRIPTPHDLEPRLLNNPRMGRYLNQKLADDELEPVSVPVAMQQPRPDTDSEKIQLEFVNNPNYKQAYGHEEMLHPSNFSTQKFLQGMESKYPNISQEEMVIPDDSYFTVNA
tara:strand:- start:580 stop:1128 length:549 start_codon:yes stop_codon:yes gene_type:complete